MDLFEEIKKKKKTANKWQFQVIMMDDEYTHWLEQRAPGMPSKPELPDTLSPTAAPTSSILFDIPQSFHLPT